MSNLQVRRAHRAELVQHSFNALHCTVYIDGQLRDLLRRLPSVEVVQQVWKLRPRAYGNYPVVHCLNCACIPVLEGKP